MTPTLVTCAGCGAPADFEFTEDPRDEALCGTCMIASARRRGVRIGVRLGVMVASTLFIMFLVLQAIVVRAAPSLPACVASNVAELDASGGLI